MIIKDDTYYDSFAKDIEAGNIEIDNTNIQRGNKLGLDLILASTGASNEEEALAMFTPGRPQIGKERGISPSVRARVPQELKKDIISLAERKGKKESEIVRLALIAYLKSEAAA